MSAKRSLAIALSTLSCCSLALAQSFPEGATVPNAAELKERLSGKVFDVQLTNGTSFRLEFTSLGYFFFDTSTGGKGNGTWTAEDGQLCSQRQGTERTCSAVRIHQNMVYAKRATGEIIRYQPR